MIQPIFVGIAGGSGSGKTTVTRHILAAFDSSVVTCLDMDSYYRDLSHLTIPERRKVNFDHPEAFETELLMRHIQQLKAGEGINKPIYDFSTSTRKEQTLRIEPAPLIIIEGIMTLVEARVRDLLDVRLFVDTDADLRFIRRLVRDINERGQTMELVVRQYTETVRPMHKAFVEPSKRHAHIIIPSDGENPVAVEMIVADLTARVQRVLAAAPIPPAPLPQQS